MNRSKPKILIHLTPIHQAVRRAREAWKTIPLPKSENTNKFTVCKQDINRRSIGLLVYSDSN